MHPPQQSGSIPMCSFGHTKGKGHRLCPYYECVKVLGGFQLCLRYNSPTYTPVHHVPDVRQEI